MAAYGWLAIESEEDRVFLDRELPVQIGGSLVLKDEEILSSVEFSDTGSQQDTGNKKGKILRYRKCYRCTDVLHGGLLKTSPPRMTGTGSKSEFGSCCPTRQF